MTDALIESMRRAVQAAPDDARLRLHLAELLLADGQAQEAVAECARVLSQDPDLAAARALLLRAMGEPAGVVPDPEPDPAPDPTATPGPTEDPAPAPPAGGFDWTAAEQEVGDIAAPMFVTDDAEAEPEASAWEVESAGTTPSTRWPATTWAGCTCCARTTSGRPATSPRRRRAISGSTSPCTTSMSP